MPLIGVLLILLGVLAAIMPSLGEMVGLVAETDGLMTEGQMLRHGVPGVGIVLGGLLLLPPVRILRALGGFLAVVAGGWLLTAPTVLDWMNGEIPRSEAAWALGAYYATGFAVTALAGLAVGVAIGRWSGERRAARVMTEEEALAREEDERAYQEERAYEEGRAESHRDEHESARYDDEVRTAEDADAVDRRVDDGGTHDEEVGATTPLDSEDDQPVRERRSRGEPAQDPEDVTSGRTD